jgi:hypothetical protein
MAGGGARVTKLNNDDDKIITLAPPAIKEKQSTKMVENCDPGRTQWAMEGQVREMRGEGEEGGRGDERNKAHLINTTGGERRQ